MITTIAEAQEYSQALEANRPPSLNEKYLVNVKSERFLIYATRQGWQLYDKLTERMVYNHSRIDGLYDTEEQAYAAASLHQVRNPMP